MTLCSRGKTRGLAQACAGCHFLCVRIQSGFKLHVRIKCTSYHLEDSTFYKDTSIGETSNMEFYVGNLYFLRKLLFVNKYKRNILKQIQEKIIAQTNLL